MSDRMNRQTAYFTKADWKALVANGIAAKRPGAEPVIVNESLVEVLTSAFAAAPECSTMDDVVAHGFALDHLVHNVVGLPVDLDRPEPADPMVLKYEYIDPVKGMGSIIQRRLGGRYDHSVQANLVAKGKYLVSTTVSREHTSKATGLPTKRQERVWAVAVSAVLMDALVLEPEVKRAWSASVHAAKNAQARITAVPESAPMVLAALDAEIVAASSARATAYAIAIDGKSSAEIAALDAAISGMTDAKVALAQAALASGPDESSGDDS